MATDTTIIDRLRAEDAFWTPEHGYDIEAMLAIMRDAADALTTALRECDELQERLNDITDERRFDDFR